MIFDKTNQKIGSYSELLEYKDGLKPEHYY